MLRERPRAVWVLIAVYAAVVISALGITSLWLDELQQLVAARDSLATLMRWVQMNPGGSPLPYLMQRPFLDLLGTSPFVVRLPAALCSIAGAAVFASLCTPFGIRSRVWATALFLALPLQFRYALEARGYSLGLLCALVSLWLFLRARERGTWAAAAWYGASVAFGLYSQPLTILPVFGELFWLIGERDVNAQSKRLVAGAALAGALLYVPWYLLERQTQEKFAVMSFYFFSWKQVTPLRFLHELSGGGYVCTAALLLAAGVGLAPRVTLKYPRLLACVVLAALAGPIALDALVNYFFAARQLLFGTPALALCAASGTERLRGWARYGLLAAFFAAAAVADYRLATVSKDNFGAQAGVLKAHLSGDACVAVAPPNQAVYYAFLVPGLERNICTEPPTTERVLAVTSPYSTEAERGQLSEWLNRNYSKVGGLRAGPDEIGVYSRR